MNEIDDSKKKETYMINKGMKDFNFSNNQRTKH